MLMNMTFNDMLLATFTGALRGDNSVEASDEEGATSLFPSDRQVHGLHDFACTI